MTMLNNFFSPTLAGALAGALSPETLGGGGGGGQGLGTATPFKRSHMEVTENISFQTLSQVGFS